MSKSVIKWFLISASAILVLTSAAKIISAGGSAGILQKPDPLFGFSYRVVLWSVGLVELVAALVVFFHRDLRVRIATVASLSTAFMVYRLGLLWMGEPKVCSCLGTLADTLGLAPATAHHLMNVVLAYLLIGSYAAGFSFWLQGRATHSSAPNLV